MLNIDFVLVGEPHRQAVKLSTCLINRSKHDLAVILVFAVGQPHANKAWLMSPGPSDVICYPSDQLANGWSRVHASVYAVVLHSQLVVDL